MEETLASRKMVEIDYLNNLNKINIYKDLLTLVLIS